MSENRVIVMANIRAKPGCAQELESQLRANAEQCTLAERGNIAYFISRSSKDDHLFQLCEMYANEEALGEHRRLGQASPSAYRDRIAELVESADIVRGRSVFAATKEIFEAAP